MPEGSKVAALVDEVSKARSRVLIAVEGLSNAQSKFKPSPNDWSVVETLEHLVLGEVSGVSKIWQAIEDSECRRESDSDPRTNPNHGLSIEKIVERTWKERETAPSIATPHIGGPLKYWTSSFTSCQSVLQDLAVALSGRDLETIVFPHFLCGPLDARQRLEFLRFHIDRHVGQIHRIRANERFPA